MTAVYRVLGPNVRVMGARGLDERLHRVALDRRKLNECKYSPTNLETYLKERSVATPYTTDRVERGTPCPPEATTQAN